MRELQNGGLSALSHHDLLLVPGVKFQGCKNKGMLVTYLTKMGDVLNTHFAYGSGSPMIASYSMHVYTRNTWK